MNTSLRLRCYCMRFVALACGLLLAMTLLGVRGAYAQEKEGSTEDLVSNVSTPTMGYITLLLAGEGSDSAVALTGGSIALYRVATVDRSDPANYRYDVSGGQFAGSGALSDLNSLSKEQLDARNPTISESLEGEVAAKGIKPLKTEDIVDGQVTFSELDEGLYLLMQSAPSEGNKGIRAFMMSVPNEAGELGVVAAPKPGAWASDEPGENKDPQSNAKSTSDKPSSSSSSSSAASTASTTAATRVPATGDGTAACLPGIIAGLALVAGGIRSRVRSGRMS